jgi:Protein of unknown function (DUF2793)
MAQINGNKITSLPVSFANGDTYGDGERALFRGIQTLVMPNCKSMALSTPPVSPTFGDTYVIGAAPSGAWAGQANSITAWAIDSQDGVVTTGRWEFYAPQAGWRIYDQNTTAFYVWNGSVWQLDKSAPKLVVTATATTTLSPLSNSSFRINLNNNATVTLNINNGAFDGQEITILYVQGGTTGSTVTAAANVHGFTTPSAGLNTVSVQRFTWDVTNTVWYALAVGTTGM